MRQAELAFRVLAELTLRPLLRDNDIGRERDIIVEEIRSYRDDPGQFVFNLFDRAFFGDTPLGWEIAGDEDSVRGLALPEIKRFWSETYRPANMVVAVAGDLDHDAVVDLVSRNFATRQWRGARFRRRSALPVERVAVEAARPPAGARRASGMPGLKRDDPDQWNSRCSTRSWARARPRACSRSCARRPGWPTTCTPSRPTIADCGALQIYAGVDPADLEAAVKAILDELRKLVDEPVPSMSSIAPAPTPAAGWSCASRRAATCRRGWVSRRRCTNAF